jgi:hypothetical protein
MAVNPRIDGKPSVKPLQTLRKLQTDGLQLRVWAVSGGYHDVDQARL